MAKDSDLEGTKKLIGALLRQPPKQHDQMKVSKQEATPLKKRVASAKQQTAKRSVSGS